MPVPLTLTITPAALRWVANCYNMGSLAPFSCMEFHTVYNSYETAGRDYIGKHSTDDPYDEYKGSFKDESFNPDNKIVLGYAKTPQGAVWLEIQYQRAFKVAEDSQFANRSYQTSDKFVTMPSGENHPNRGKSRPDLTLRNLLDNPAKRPETKEKIRKSRNSLEHNRALKESRQSPKSRQKSKEAAERQWSQPGAKEALSERRIGEGNPCHGKKWWVNRLGETLYQAQEPEGDWQRGRVYRDDERL